jgi:DNA-binding transcriptional LysR family regulator
MDLSSLEIFCAVATAHSVTRAAAQLSRVQSNVTTRVKQLEEELKVPLFSRDGNRMTLTSNGERFLDYARRLLSLAEEARQAMSPEEPSGRLRIGTMESTAAARLPALLASYHSRWPDVSLEISIGTSGSLVDDVAFSRLDCAFVADTGDALDPVSSPTLPSRDLVATRAFSEELFIVLPRNHPPIEGPGDLRISTIATFADGCTYRKVLECWLRGRHGEPEKYWKVLEQASYHAILACVASGSCFALCPRSVLDLQRVPLDLWTRSIAAVNTYLVSRAAYSSAAYDELVRSVHSMPQSGNGSVNARSPSRNN